MCNFLFNSIIKERTQKLNKIIIKLDYKYKALVTFDIARSLLASFWSPLLLGKTF